MGHWELVKEIGIRRFGDEPTKRLELHWPTSVHRLTDGQTVILDEVYGNGRIYALSRDNTAVTEIKPKVLLDDSLYFPYLAPIDDHQLLCLSGKSPREIVTISHLGEVVQRIWNSWNPDNLLWPRCVATWGDDLVVADGNIQRGSGARPPGICIMTKTGKVLWQWRPGSSEHGLTDPKHVLPLPNGRIVVTEPDVHRVLCLDLNGQICWIYGEYGKPGREFGRLAGPCSTSLTSRETLLVADTLNCRLIELNLEGRFLRHIGGDRDSIGAPVGPLAYPFGAVDEPDQNATLVADTGNLRVARIHQGTVETLAGASRPPRRLLSYPRSVQTVSERLWLVSDTGNDRVIFIDPNGHVAWQYGNGIPRKEAVLHWPRCARVTGTGNVIIADSLNSSLIEVGPRGVVLNRIETIKHQGRNVRLDDPHDIFLTSRGTLLIVDSRSAFVCEITNDGRALWGLGEPFGDSVLRDPHQAVETEDGEVFIVDPEVGLIRLADQASKLDISKAFFDAQGENIHFSMPKAMALIENSLVIGGASESADSLLFVNRDTNRASGIGQLLGDTVGIDRRLFLFHDPRGIDTVGAGRLIVADHGAHRLMLLERR